MSKPRKTVRVAALIEAANRALAADRRLSEDLTPEQAFRLGIASMLGHVLHTADAYAGFGYQDSELRPDRTDLDTSRLRDGYDDSRRVYYFKVGVR